MIAPTSSHREDVVMLAAVRAEMQRRASIADPAGWAERRLGIFVWSKQREIMESVRDNRLTAVHSCHQSGKSFIAARIVAWWLSEHPPGEAFVLTSAPTGSQVKAILWREIARAHSQGRLPGRLNQTEWWMKVGDREEIVGLGRKPSDVDVSRLQGHHARFVLVVFDEAAGMSKALWDAGDSLIANDDSRFLAIGNPDDPTSEFADICKPASGWNVIGIDAFETPNFTGEEVPERIRPVLVGKTWVEEKRRKWGESNPMWIAKVRGRFPETTIDGLVPVAWVKAAIERDLKPKTRDERDRAAETWTRELGVDVGGGGDRSSIAFRNGPIVRIIHRDQNPNTMQTCGKVLECLRKTGATAAKVDEIGIGKGIVDRAQELDRPVYGVNVGRAPRDTESFQNLRAEGYWALRERFQDGTIDIDGDDEDLVAQLVDLRFKRSSAGKIQIESKDEMRRRGRASPDDADAVMLAFLPETLRGPAPVTVVEAEWG